MNKITQCVDAGLPGFIKIGISGYDPTVNYSLSIDDPTFGDIDPACIDANGIFRVETTGEEGDFTVTVTAPNPQCGGTMSGTLQYTVEKESFIAEENIFMNISIFGVQELFPGWYATQTFTWTINGQTHTPLTSGFPYVTDAMPTTSIQQAYVTVTDNATGCSTRKFRVSGDTFLRSGTASVNEFTTVHIPDEQNMESQFALYPNPASTELTIDAPAEGNINFHIISMTGSIVREGVNQQPKTTIDVSDLPTGTYIVTVLQGANRYAKQFIKK